MSGAATYHTVASAFLEALGARDWEALRGLLTEDVVWTLPGHSTISGRAVGVDAAMARAQRIVGYGLTFTLKHILIGQEGMALSLHNTASRGEAVLDEHLATVCRFRGDRICTIDSYLSDVAMADAFFV